LEVEQGVSPGYGIVDIGPDTTKMFGNYIGDAKMIIWNGPMGVFEVPEFARGTIDIACNVAHSNATSIVGGGDSAAAIHQSGYANLISHVSTGGGATLEILKGKTLPAVAVLDQM
jgi:phosphoglycerate kinase